MILLSSCSHKSRTLQAVVTSSLRSEVEASSNVGMHFRHLQFSLLHHLCFAKGTSVYQGHGHGQDHDQDQVKQASAVSLCLTGHPNQTSPLCAFFGARSSPTNSISLISLTKFLVFCCPPSTTSIFVYSYFVPLLSYWS